jgi:hypothetical protein
MIARLLVLVCLLLVGCSSGKKDSGGGTTDAPDSKEDVAKAQIRKIETASFQYSQKAGDFPDSVLQLAVRLPDGGAPLIEERDTIDPWGQPFVIEKDKRHPKTDKPRIYSQGEPGKNKPISNW